MKLLTYETLWGGSPPASTRCGVLQGEHVLDVTALLGLSRTLRDVRDLLEWDDASLERVRDALERGAPCPAVPLQQVRLRSPVLQPPTMRDFMVFEEHATAQGTRKREEAWYRLPVFYFTNTLRIFGPDDAIPYPSASTCLDYELEIGCVIRREGHDVSEADALDHVAGFCIFNDWSCRDLQRDEVSVGLGPAKAKDFATSLGPWLVTPDELAPLLKNGRLELRCSVRVNGDVWLRDADARDAHHTWGAMIERASRDSRIVPGDVLGSGTVGGGTVAESVRKGYERARFLEPGDIVEMEVETLGVLRGSVGPRNPAPEGYRFRAPEPVPLPERGSARDYVYARRPGT